MTGYSPERGDIVSSILSYTEFTAPVSITATTEATANIIVSSPSILFDGSTLAEIEFYTPDATLAANAGGNALVITLFQDGVSLGFIAQCSTGGTTFLDYQLRPSRRFTPTAGSHVYSIRGWRSNANCTVGAGVGGVAAFNPGWVKVSRF